MTDDSAASKTPAKAQAGDSDSIAPAGSLPLSVRGLRKQYRRRVVLDGVSFEVRPGESVALAGPNGAGKSTLIGCITADRVPTAGEVRICGADPFAEPREAAACLGFVPEQPFLYPELTVAELLRFVAAARGLGDAAASAETARLLALLGLAGAEGTLCRELSQGMGRKTAIAAALLHRPTMIVLDEALNGLDRTSAERLVAELDARRAEGAAVLIASHDLDFLARWCGRGILLPRAGQWLALEGEAWETWRRAPRLDFDAASDAGAAPAPEPPRVRAADSASPGPISTELEVEWAREIGATAYVAARMLEVGRDFLVREGATLAGAPLHVWADAPRAVDATGNPRLDLFIFALRRRADLARFEPGQRVMLTSPA